MAEPSKSETMTTLRERFATPLNHLRTATGQALAADWSGIIAGKLMHKLPQKISVRTTDGIRRVIQDSTGIYAETYC